MKAGFTLVEVMVAVAVGALLILGVTAATQSTVKTAERQRSEARLQEERARAIELLRQDWRGRVKILRPAMKPSASCRALILTTTADSSSNARSTRLVTWKADEAGLSRTEEGVESLLLHGTTVLDFWDGVAWRPEPGLAPYAVRLMLWSPPESVILR